MRRQLETEPYRVYSYIARHIQQKGYSPLIADMVADLQLAEDDVRQALHTLISLGHITYLSPSSRMIYLTDQIPQAESRAGHPERQQQKKKQKKYQKKKHDRQEVYNFIKSYLAEHKYPPSLRDIAKGLDIPSTSTVRYCLDDLRDQGYLTYVPGRSRSLCLTGQPYDSTSTGSR